MAKRTGGRETDKRYGAQPPDGSGGTAVGEWVEFALCQGLEELFFSPRGYDWTAAKKVCSDCPVKRTCLEYALHNREVHGTWGGQNQVELRFLLAENAGGEPKRYPGRVKCPWCKKDAIEFTFPPARSGLPETCSCTSCGFSWERVYVPRRGRRKSPPEKPTASTTG